MPRKPNTPKAKALRLTPPTLAQGGLAFLLAYTVAYFMNAM